MSHVRLLASTAVFALIIFAAANCGAQERRIVSMGGSATSLLALPAVQKELKLSDEQVRKAEALASKSRKQLEEFVRLDLPGVDRHQAGDALQKKRAEMDTQESTERRTFLSAEQQTRLAQIQLQQEGASGMVREETAKKLKLTASQEEAVKQILAEMQDEIHELYATDESIEEDTSASGVRVRRIGTLKPQTVQKLQAIREKALGRAVAKLNPEQVATWKQLIGEPFKLSSATSEKRGG